MDFPISTSTTLVTRNELFSTSEQLALAGFLAGYSGLTRDAYTLDLRQYVAWCTEDRLAVFGRAAPTSSASPATSSPWRAGPLSPAGADRSGLKRRETPLSVFHDARTLSTGVFVISGGGATRSQRA